MGNKKWYFVIIIVLLVLALLGNCKGKAETDDDDWLPIPVPTGSWEEYQTQHPLVTSVPTPTVEPSVTPRPERPPLGNLAPRTLASVRGYKYNLNTGMYYLLYSPWTMSSSMPIPQDLSRTLSNGLYTWDTANLSTPLVLSSQNTLHGYSEYIRVNFTLRFGNSSSNTPVVGEGLDYGYYYTGTISWNVKAVAANGTTFYNCPVRVYVKLFYDNNATEMLSENTIYDLADLTNGIQYIIPSRFEDRLVYRADIILYLGLTNESYIEEDSSTSQTRDYPYGGSDYYLKNSGGLKVTAQRFVLEKTNTNIWQLLSDLPTALIGIFVPTQSQVSEWIQYHINHDAAINSPVSLYYDTWVQLLSNLVNSDDDRNFHLRIPALKINVGGTDYTYFNGIDYNLSEADIPIPQPAGAVSHTLFYYTRLVGDVIIGGGFISFLLYMLWKRIFEVSYASGVQG